MDDDLKFQMDDDFKFYVGAVGLDDFDDFIGSVSILMDLLMSDKLDIDDFSNYGELSFARRGFYFIKASLIAEAGDNERAVQSVARLETLLNDRLDALAPRNIFPLTPPDS